MHSTPMDMKHITYAVIRYDFLTNTSHFKRYTEVAKYIESMPAFM